MKRKITDIHGTFRLHNGVKMPYFGLGVYQTENGKEVVNAVQWALEAGYRHIDTASIYKNEIGVGQAILKSTVDREEVFLVSKVWNSDQGFDNTLRAFDTSLKKLGTDYLDLYLIHWPVEGKYKDTWRALETLYRMGKVKAIGVSNFLQHHLENLLESAEIIPMVNQMEFHPFMVQQELIDFCHSLKIQYEGWSPLMQGHIFEHSIFEEIAARYKKNVAQIVLRWNLQKEVITIPKSSKKEHILANAEIFDFKLNPEDVKILDGLERGQRFGPDPNTFDF
jgi:diketogulonate reductase-like aldo/keto reductase